MSVHRSLKDLFLVCTECTWPYVQGVGVRLCAHSSGHIKTAVSECLGGHRRVEGALGTKRSS
jgi:hypothetical protein